MRLYRTALLLVANLAAHSAAPAAESLPGVVKSEFIYDKAPFPSCHASTIVATKSGLVCALFGGSDEGDRDVGIWVSRHDGEKWSQVVEVANGVRADGKRHPCWNPVLFRAKDGPLDLYYKVGPSPDAWWGMKMSSTDDGRTWSKPKRLPDGFLGPVKNKAVQLSSGTVLAGSSTEHKGWRVHMERSTDSGKTFSLVGPLNDGKSIGAIQPTILEWPGGKIQILCRSQQSRIVESWSTDDGKTWSPLEKTVLPNPNSGIDAVKLADGRALLVYNHTPLVKLTRPRGREMINVAVSEDGRKWRPALVLENEKGEFSYPAAIQAPDGLVHITYTHHRQRVKHVVVDPAKLKLGEYTQNGNWPGL
ncbi:MAG: sialidase [Planctomycetota bacterium]|nr:MAG: sialidase [Planctomycetota bacterium]